MPGAILSARIERSGAAEDYPNLDGWVLSLVIEDWGGKTVDSIDLGWTAPNDSIGNDPGSDTPTVAVSLSRAGFSVSGSTVSTTTRSRTLYGTKRIRKVYPLNSQFLTDVVGDDLRVYIGLSDFVYASDSSITVSVAAGAIAATDASTNLAASGLSVSNESALLQPKVKGNWINRAASLPFVRLTGNYAGAARGVCPGGVLGALFTVTDESTNVATEFVADPEPLGDERAGSTNDIKVYGYLSDLDISGLNQGELGTARVRIYPIDGDASSVYDSADYASAGDPEHLRNRTHRIDHTGAWPTVYVYVDAANGDNGTGVASTTAATAQALPYADMWAALTDARDFINTNYSRSNSLDGVVCRFMDNAGSDQNFPFGRTGFASTMTAPGAAPIFEPDPDNTGDVAFTTKGSAASNILCANAVFRMRIEPASAAQVNFFASIGTDDWYVLDRIDSVLSVSTSTGAPLFNSGFENVTPYCCKFIDWYSDPFAGGGFYWPEFDGWERPSGFSNANAAFIGWELLSGTNAWLVSTEPTLFGNSVEVTNQRISGFRHLSQGKPFYAAGEKLTNCSIDSGWTVRDPDGTTIEAVMEITTYAVEDTYFVDVSALGQRVNIQNGGASNHAFDRFVVEAFATPYLSSKHDVFEEDESYIDGWQTHWGVRWRNIYNGNADTFPYEFEGIHVYSQPAPATAAEQEPDVEDLTTDPTPTASSELAGLILAGTVPSKRFDIAGVEVPNDGTGYAGALQGPLPVVVDGTGQVQTDGTIRMIFTRLSGLWGSTITPDNTKITAISQVTGGTRSFTVGSVSGAGSGTLQVILTPTPLIYSTASGGVVTVTIGEGWLTDENGNTNALTTGIADGNNSSTRVPPSTSIRRRLTGGSAASFSMRIT
jgi:hypothetical protein